MIELWEIRCTNILGEANMSANSLAKQSLSRDMNFYSINIIIFCTFWTLFKLFIFFPCDILLRGYYKASYGCISIIQKKSITRLMKLFEKYNAMRINGVRDTIFV